MPFYITFNKYLHDHNKNPKFIKIEKYMKTVPNFDVYRNMNASGNNDITWRSSVSERQILCLLCSHRNWVQITSTHTKGGMEACTVAQVLGWLTQWIWSSLASQSNWPGDSLDKMVITKQMSKVINFIPRDNWNMEGGTNTNITNWILDVLTSLLLILHNMHYLESEK